MFHNPDLLAGKINTLQIGAHQLEGLFFLRANTDEQG